MRLPEGLNPFHPPRWARGGHLQTLLGNALRPSVPELPWERLSLRLADGDTLRFRMVRGTEPVVVYLFHGLGGHAGAHYIRLAAARLHRRGFSVVALDHRGSGEGRGLAARAYHGGASGDLAAVIQAGRVFFPDAVHVGVGFSLSANMLLLLMGRDVGLGAPDAALAVAPPVDLAACSRRMGRGFNRVYDRRFTRLLKAQVQERWELGLIDPIPFPKGMDLAGFDEAFTAPMAGFADRHAYYAACSAGPHLALIQAPTVILSAEDDPLAPAGDVRAFPFGPGLQLHAEAYGGHMGFVTRERRRWLEDAVEAWVLDLLRRLQPAS